MTPKQIARRIANDLFAHGATRIALKRPHVTGVGEQTLGGWDKQAAQDQVD